MSTANGTAETPVSFEDVALATRAGQMGDHLRLLNRLAADDAAFRKRWNAVEDATAVNRGAAVLPLDSSAGVEDMNIYLNSPITYGQPNALAGAAENTSPMVAAASPPPASTPEPATAVPASPAAGPAAAPSTPTAWDKAKSLALPLLAAALAGGVAGAPGIYALFKGGQAVAPVVNNIRGDQLQPSVIRIPGKEAPS